MSTCIVILARKNSKRIKNKNIRKFCSVPLVEHTVITAKELGIKTYLVTDCNVTKEIGKKYGVEVVHKKDEFAQDRHDTNREIKELIPVHEKYILLQPTSPIRNVEKIKSWIKEFEQSGKNTGFAVYPINKYFYLDNAALNFNYWNRDSNGCTKKTLRAETGSFYIFKKCQLKEKHVIDYNSMILFDDDWYVDLDTEAQWQHAEVVANNNLGALL